MDNNTGKRTSLRTDSEDAARQIVEAKNNAERQPVLNLQIAKAYLAGSDNGITTRTCTLADPLSGTDFTCRVVIVLLQMFVEIFLSIGQIFCATTVNIRGQTIRFPEGFCAMGCTIG